MENKAIGMKAGMIFGGALLFAVGIMLVATVVNIAENPDSAIVCFPGTRSLNDLIPFLFAGMVIIVGIGLMLGGAIKLGKPQAMAVLAILAVFGASVMATSPDIGVQEVKAFSHDNAVEAASTFCLLRDGSNSMTGDLDMGGNSVTNTASGNLAGTATFLVCSSTAQNTGKCDYEAGGTDDDVQIQAALDACAAAGCRVAMTEGDFSLSSPIDMGDNQALEGSGQGVTTLTIADATVIDGIQNDDQASGNSNITLRNLTIDGNKANQGDTTTTRHGIEFLKVESALIENVTVRNYQAGNSTTNAEAVRISGGGTQTRHFKVNNLTVHDNSGIGVRIMFAMRSFQAVGIEAYDNDFDGIVIDHSEGSYTNLRARSNGKRGIYIHNVFDANLTNLDAILNEEHGISVVAMVASVGASWQARNNSVNNANTFSDLFFEEDSSLSYGRTRDIIITGIGVGGDSNIAGANPEKNGIEFETPGAGRYSNITLLGVRVAGTTTGDYTLPSDKTQMVIQDHPAGANGYRLVTGKLVIFRPEVVHDFKASQISDFTVTRTSSAGSPNSATERIIGITDTSSPRTVTLSTADVDDGRIIVVKDESGAAGTNNITVATEGAETIDGAATATISTNYGSVRVYSDGSNWFTW